MQSATTQSTTTDIIVNRRRVIDYPFRELSFAEDSLEKPQMPVSFSLTAELE